MHIVDRSNQVFTTWLPAVPHVGHILHVSAGGPKWYVVRGVEWTCAGASWPEEHPGDPSEADLRWARENSKGEIIIYIDDTEFDETQGRMLMRNPIK